MYSTIGTLHGLSLVDGPSVSTSRCIKRHRYWYVTKMSDFSPFYFLVFFINSLNFYISYSYFHFVGIAAWCSYKEKERIDLPFSHRNFYTWKTGRQCFAISARQQQKKKYKTTTKKPKKKFKIKTNTKGWTAFNKLSVIIPPPICSSKHRTQNDSMAP